MASEKTPSVPKGIEFRIHIRNRRGVDSSWIEWTACAVAAAASIGRERRHALLALGALAAAWIFGTATWLLFPAVTGVLALLLLAGSDRRWRIGGRIMAVGGSVLSALLCALFPLPEAPPLAGGFAVGCLDFELAAEGDAPPLIARVWYPADGSGEHPRAAWLPDPALAMHLPFHRIGQALSRALSGPEPAKSPARFPVIFYEHSWTGHRAENVVQLEDLASRGFVVVAVDHPGQAARVKYGNGEVIVGKLPQPDLASEAGVKNFEELAEKCLQERAFHLAAIRKHLIDGGVPLLGERLDFSRMGVFGISFGGTCAVRLCATDPSFRAGANEDGLFLADAMPQGPFLFFDEEQPSWLLKEARAGEGAGEAQVRKSEKRIETAMLDSHRYREILAGTRHEAFSDRIFTCRIPRLVHAGSRPTVEVHRMVTSRLGEFFSKELGGTTAH